MFELSIIVNFEAAHNIVGYQGKCQRLHGHNWKVKVTVAGSKLDELGMVIDFRDLKSEVNKIIEKLDHYYLNELAQFKALNPTAENIAKYLFDELSQSTALKQKEVSVKSMTVWEAANSAIKYSAEI